MKYFSALAVVSLACLTMCPSLMAGEAARVIPRPQVENYGRGLIRFEAPAVPFSVSFKNVGPAESPACENGIRLLTKRLEALGAGKLTIEQSRSKAQFIITRASATQFTRMLRRAGAREEVSGKRLDQAYVLMCRPAHGNGGAIQLTACSDLGIYYGVVSLCQLLDKADQGGICVPAVKIADWPEIGLRLSKVSATHLSLPALEECVNWLPLYKMNLLGLQFHGTNSNHTEVFRKNVKAICSRARQSGILETIVYFCPFRGKGYDFNQPADRERYATFLQWMLDQGANGIEVDYNDWPGRATPIEDVINLACRAVLQKNPHAYILYCPPNRGSSQYRGRASPEMARILSQVPTNVWPLWTGPSTRNALIEKPLRPEDAEAWARAAGRRPFLWVNRVAPQDSRRRPFSRPVEEVPGAFVFRGDFLPKDLNRLFEGMHFNAAPPSSSNPETLAYLATAADYVWNPRGWEPVESCRRARRFVEIMRPLVGE